MRKILPIRFLEEEEGIFLEEERGGGGLLSRSVRACLGGFSEMESQMYARSSDEVLIDETTNSFPWEIGLEGANNSGEEIWIFVSFPSFFWKQTDETLLSPR